MYGPERGPHHDITLLRQRGIEDGLAVASIIHGVQHYLYGDAAYMLGPCMQTEFSGETASVLQDTSKTALNALWESLE